MPYKDPKRQKDYQSKWHQKNKTETHSRRLEAQKRHKKRNLRFLDRVKSKGCVVCGYNRCPQAIDFHHLRDKKYTISAAATQQRHSIRKLKEELRKCIRLCANCHRELHAGILEI